MSFTEVYTATASTVGSSEVSCVNNSTSIATVTDDGCYYLFVDTTNVAPGDEFEVALREKIVSGGTQRRWVVGRLVGGCARHFISPSVLLVHGWDFTLKKISGADCAFDWSIRAVTGTAISEVYTASASTVGGTEKFLTNNSTSSSPITTDGYYQLFVDTTNVTSADAFEVAYLEKILSGGSQRRNVLDTLGGIGGAPAEHWIGPAMQWMHGGDYSLKKLTGTDRAFDWSIRGVTSEVSSVAAPGGLSMALGMRMGL